MKRLCKLITGCRETEALDQLKLDSVLMKETALTDKLHKDLVELLERCDDYRAERDKLKN